ncbi:hypothetical protein ACLI4Z_15200 [Natrialbaceae archaeon A-arb3/5]
MSVPGIVQSTLDGEEIAARVSLGGEDELFITPTSTLVYRAEGLLSDESVDEYAHDADRLTLSEGRRKTKFSLEYPLEGTQEFTVPSSKTDAALHPVLAGVLNGNGITETGETVSQTYRFSELTLIITSERLVKHIGGAVWDEDYEEYHFGDVTNLSFEDGSVATQIVLAVDGRPQRIKAPNEEANDLRERLKRALFEYHDVTSLEELNEVIGEDEDEAGSEPSASMDFGDGVDPLDANPPEPEDHEPTEAVAESGQSDSSAAKTAVPDSIDARSDQRQTGDDTWEQTETAASDSNAESQDLENDQQAATVETGNVFSEADESAISTDGQEQGTSQVESTTRDPSPEVVERLENLETALDRQNDLIEQQQQTIEQLIAELRQGR